MEIYLYAKLNSTQWSTLQQPEKPVCTESALSNILDFFLFHLEILTLFMELCGRRGGLVVDRSDLTCGDQQFKLGLVYLCNCVSRQKT